MTSNNIIIMAEGADQDDLAMLPVPTRTQYIPYAFQKKGDEHPAWMHFRDTLFGPVMTKGKGPIHGLPKWDFAGFFNQNERRIPAEFISIAHGYFKWAFETFKTEAAVLIIADWDDNLDLFCPVQDNSGGGVHYEVDATELPEGYAVVGSLHSHCDFSAFHSGTDESDADRNDGLHITLGHVTREIAEAAVMFAFSQVHWDWTLEDVIDGEQPPAGDFPEEWKTRIVKRERAIITTATKYEYTNVLFDEDSLEAYYAANHVRMEDWSRRHWSLKPSDYRAISKERGHQLLKQDMLILKQQLKELGFELKFNVSISPERPPKD